MKKLMTIFFLGQMVTLSLFAQTKADFDLKEFQGIYQDDQGQKYFVNPRTDFPHFTVMKSGETHMLRSNKVNLFDFSSTRNNWDSIGGTIEFQTEKTNRICLKYTNKKPTCAQAVSWSSTELALNLNDDLFISGNLIEPQNLKNNFVAVLLHGDGDNDRYDLFDIGMYLVSEGYSIFTFDKRNVGKSRGAKIKGDNYDAISREYADDAVKIILKLKNDFPGKRFGVIGLSQGGWIGSIVSAKVPELAFYINIAGNISIGWHQWQHYMISYLKRNGFSPDDISEAEDYFQAFFATGLEKTTFLQYRSKLEQYREKSWFKRLEKIKLIEWRDENSAIQVIKSNSNNPSVEVKKVKSPTLGIFFEFDHSTPSDSPAIFLNSLLNSNSKDVSVRVFPNTTHGGWVVDGYYFDSTKITKMDSRAYYFLIDWLNSIKF